MVQVKKESVRDAILEAAFVLFSARGYSETTLAEIGRGAGVTVSNIYNYFSSKLEILATLYAPLLEERLETLAADARKISDTRARLKFILLSILRDIPEENSGFANNWIQAISTKKPDEDYSRAFLLGSEDKMTEIIREALPPDAGDRFLANGILSHLLFMAFDGFAINYHLAGPSQRVDAITDMMVEMILGADA